MGLILDGKVIEFEGGDRIRDGRKVGAWWGRDEYGTGPRAGTINIFTGHWTAGEAGLTSYEDDGPFVVRGMKARKSHKHPERRLQVSIPFVIGACAPDDEWAPIWQTMDPAHNTAVHVGERAVNRRSLACEVVSCGVPGWGGDVRKRPWEARVLVGHRERVSLFYPGQIRAWQFLIHAITSHDEDTALGEALRRHNILIPRRVPVATGGPLSDRFTRRQQNTWKGLQEHMHVPSTRKIDAGTLLLQAALDAGFEAVPVR